MKPSLFLTAAYLSTTVCSFAANAAELVSFRQIVGSERKVMDAEAANATYSYAPSLMWTGSRMLSWSCVTSPTGAGDAIALTYSDNQRNWSAPTVIFQERVASPDYFPYACDPSVVIVQAPGESQTYYYLYYGGARKSGGFIAVARSPVNNPAGFQKWIGGDPRLASSWKANINTAPRQVVSPQQPCNAPGSACYGAGQPSVVVKDGRFFMWFTDTSATPAGIMLATSNDGVKFSSPIPTNVTGPSAASIDVKWDPASGMFLMFDMLSHTSIPTISVRSSRDGITWSAQTAIGKAPAWSNNIGIAGNPQGFLDRGRPLYIGYGAPWDLRSDYDNTCMTCVGRGWGYWDLYATQFTLGAGGIRVPTPPTPPTPPAPQDSKPIYRYYSGVHHFYTDNRAEGDRTGWRLEGIAFYVGRKPLANSSTLMRCRLRGNQLHFLSRALDCEGQLVDGPLGWTLSKPVSGSQEIARCRRGTAYLATIDRNECFANGFVMEGPLGFAPR